MADYKILKGVSTLVNKAGDYIFELFRDELPGNFVFHDFHHTLLCVTYAKKMAKGMELDEKETEILLLAAWFHDAGMVKNCDDHEKFSVEIAEAFLTDEGFPTDGIAEIGKTILATHMPQKPENLLQQILCDADLSNLGSDNFVQRNELLRLEWELTGKSSFEDLEWYKHEFEFLSIHKYHTIWAQINLDEQKNQNVLYLRKLIRREDKREKELKQKLSIKEKDRELKIRKGAVPDRGIETMFRTTNRTHMALSSIADNKANIMLSINALIISLVISGLASKFDENPYLILPTVIILVFCVLSIVFATLSTRPKVTKGRFSRDDIEKKRANLLFFGNFYNVSLDDYEWGMGELMKDREFLYNSLTRDLYFLGRVLGRKYKFLRLTYTIFMWGLIISVIAFAATFIMAPM